MAGAATSAAARAAVIASWLVPIECPSFVKARAWCLSMCYMLYRRGPGGCGPLRLSLGRSGLLLRVGFLLEEIRARLEGIVELVLGDQQHVVRKDLLARLALAQLLDPLVLVVSVDGAGRTKAHEVAVTFQAADLDLVGEAAERGRVDEGRLVEPGVFRVVRRDVGELEHAQRIGGGVGVAGVELLAGL